MAGLLNSYVFTSAPPGSVTTFNPADKASILTLSNGDLTVEHAPGGSFGAVRSTTSKTTGKWHFEVTADLVPGSSGSYDYIGVCNSTFNLSANPAFGDGVNNISYRTGGIVWANGADVFNDSSVAFTTGETMAVEVDVDAKQFSVYVDGTWRGPYSFSYMSGAVFAFVTLLPFADRMTVNFGAVSFVVSPQSGYSAWG